MANRLTDPNPVYLNSFGQVCAGGSLSFFLNGTSTPTNTYSDQALTVSNGTSVTLGTDGRSPVEIWSGPAIRVVLKDSSGATIWTRDNVQAGSGLPSPVINQFIWSADGLSYSSTLVRQVPDPTGNAGKYVTTTDGINVTFGPISLAAGAGASLSGYVASNMTEVSQAVAANTATTTIDWSAGGVVEMAHSANTTLAFTNTPTTGQSAVLTIIRTKDNTGTARTLAWPTGTKTPGGAALSITQTANAIDAYTVICRGGVTPTFLVTNANAFA